MKEVRIRVEWESFHSITVDDDVDVTRFDLDDDTVHPSELRSVTPENAEFVGWDVVA